MITVIKKPLVNAVFLSGNPLEIAIESTIGANHYFELTILVDNVLFDKQVWDKIDDNKCNINFANIFEGIFTNTFQEVTTTELKAYPNLLKKIDITIKEHKSLDDSIVNTEVLDSFFVLPSTREKTFNHTVNLQKMSKMASYITLKNNSVLVLPLWITSTDVTITLTEGATEHYNQTFTPLTKGLYSFNINLSDFTFTTDQVKISITNGADELIQNIHFKDYYAYDIVKLYYKNSFHVFEYIEFYGVEKASNNFKRKTHQLLDNTDFVVSVINKKRHKINTSYFLASDLPLLEEVNSSKELFYFTTKFVPVIVITKKAVGLDTSVNYYDDFIELQETGVEPVDNSFNY